MSKKVMIIDDEPDIRAYLMAVLEDEGYETCTIEANESILDAVKKMKPDLIILDIMMPRRSGVSVYKELRASDATKRIPVVLISGMPAAKQFVDEEFRKLVDNEAIPLPDGFVEKPIKLPVLVEAIKKLLE